MKKWIGIAVLSVIMVIISTALVLAEVDYSDKNLIQQVQKALNDSGYDCGTPDGVIGAKTNEAIASYRAANGMTSGVGIDDELYQALFGGEVDQSQSGTSTDDIEANIIIDDECCYRH